MNSLRSLLACLALCAPTSAFAQGWMHWPLERAAASRTPLTQGFYGDYITYCGRRDSCGTHNGYDIACPVGTPVYAVAPGVVDAINPADARTADYGNAGIWVRVRHDGSTVPGLGAAHFVAYLHLSRVDVAVGAAVNTTTRLGLSGRTGGVGPHLHLHTTTAPNYCGGPVDPGCPTGAWVRGSVVPAAFIDAPGCQQVCRPVSILWVQPAAYGNEPYAGTPAPGCGDLDYRGRCDGEVLHWCQSNAAMVANCADRNAVCAFQDPTEGFNCLRCDPSLMRPLLGAARCEGTRWLHCDGTRAVSEDCAPSGRNCTEAGCVAPPPPPPPPPPPLDASAPVDAVEAPSDISTDTFTDRPISTRDSSFFDSPPTDAADVQGDVSTMDADRDLREVSGGCDCAVGTSPHGGAGVLALAALWAKRRRRNTRPKPLRSPPGADTHFRPTMHQHNSPLASRWLLAFAATTLLLAVGCERRGDDDDNDNNNRTPASQPQVQPAIQPVQPTQPMQPTIQPVQYAPQPQAQNTGFEQRMGMAEQRIQALEQQQAATQQQLAQTQAELRATQEQVRAMQTQARTYRRQATGIMQRQQQGEE